MGRTRRLVADAALAVTLAALTWGTIELDQGCECHRPWWALALILAQTLPLALRRVTPVPVWLLVGLATGVHGASEVADPPVFFGALVATYTVASMGSRRSSLVVAGVTGLAIAAAMLAAGDASLTDVVLNAVVFGTAWILGDSVRVHRAYTAELEDRAARLERQRQEDAWRAAAAERLRMSREVHDIVAHHVSLIVVQSEAAQVLLTDRPEKAVEAVGAIGATARQALGELRRLLGTLRRDDPGPENSLSPQPGDTEIESLVGSVREAGLPVQLVVDGTPRPVPPAVALSAYRIVQEALTNVLKHAGPAAATVSLRYGDRQLEVGVADDGVGGEPDGDGHGLLGMRERVALAGGELHAGPRPDGGFAGHARLPLEVDG